jgi:hypothetical protein
MLIKSASACVIFTSDQSKAYDKLKKQRAPVNSFPLRLPDNSLSLHNEDEEKGHDKSVDPGGFRNGLANEHSPCKETRLIRVSADGFAGFSRDKTLTDTWSDGSKSHSHSGSQQGCGAYQFSSGDIHTHSSLDW